MTKNPSQAFGNDLRRVVLLSHLLDQCVEYLNMNDQCPPFIAGAGIDIRRTIKRYKHVLKGASPVTWAQVERELQEERIDDLLELFEEMMTVTNVSDVITEIRAHKKPVITHEQETN